MEIKNGVISEIYNDSDYELAGNVDINNIPPAKNRYSNLKIEYHQPDVSDMSCTLHGTLTAFSNLTGYKFSLEERKALWEKAKILGASDQYGWYLNKAVDLVREYVNTLNIGKFVTFRIAIGFDEYYSVIQKGYSVITGYNGNSKWNKESVIGVITGTDFNPFTYSHIISSIDDTPKTKNEVTFVDNYLKTRIKNSYIVQDIIPLYKSNTIFKYGYVFAYDDIEPLLDKKLIEKCKRQFIAITKPSKDGVKPSGEIFYCNKNAEIITMNSAGYELKHQMLLDSKCINISKDDLYNFKKIGFKN